MQRDNDNLKDRRSVIAGLGVAGAGLALGAAAAQAQTSRGRSGGFQPARHDEDAWMDELPGTHRIFVDTATANGGAEGLIYTNNLYGAHASAYAGKDSDLAMILCYRHFSTPFGYGDAIWQKYGEALGGIIQFTDPTTGEAPKANLFNASDRSDLPNFGMTVDGVVARGAHLAICANATRFLAGQLAQQTGMSADDVFEELVAGAIPGSRFVSAGVMALTRAQEYGYSLLVAG